GTASCDYIAVVIAGLKDLKFYVIDTFCLHSKMKQSAYCICDYQMQLPSSSIIHWLYVALFWIDDVSRIFDDTQSENGVQLTITIKQLPLLDKLNIILTMQPYFQN
ncbi:hypothetical protein, partial [Ornithobacterium rhinotracheale]